MNEKTKKKALKALEGMKEIVENEMLIAGEYATQVVNLDLAKQGAICGGRKFCAIGSLWAGYGIQPQIVDHRGRDFVLLPGAMERSSEHLVHNPWKDQPIRSEFVKNRPGLKAALTALNDAANEFVKNHEVIDYDDLDPEYGDLIESLFETEFGTPNLTNDDLHGIIENAEERLKAA